MTERFQDMVCEIGRRLVALQRKTGGQAALDMGGRCADRDIDQGADVFHDHGLRPERKGNNGSVWACCGKIWPRNRYA